MPQNLLLVADQRLRTELVDRLVPALDIGPTILFESAPVPHFYDAVEPDWERVRQSMRSASFALVGLTGVHADEFWGIEAAAEFSKPCGLFIKCAQPIVWAALSTMHRMRPFSFVVAVGSKPVRHPERFFTGIKVFSVFDLENGVADLGAQLSELACFREFA